MRLANPGVSLVILTQSRRRKSVEEISGFNNFIEGMKLLDIPCVGRKYTWYTPNGKTKSRIDRFLVPNQWLQTQPGSKQYVLGRQVSDHCTLILKTHVVEWGPKPFRFLDIWQEDKRFSDFVQKKWEKYVGKVIRFWT